MIDTTLVCIAMEKPRLGAAIVGLKVPGIQISLPAIRLAQHLDRLKTFAANRGIAVEYDASIAPAMGVSSGGHIRLVPDLPKAEEFAVLAHEIANEMLHHRKN
jgi:hypothetical protein